MSKEDMRGLFFLAKGQYRKIEPSFINEVTKDRNYLGGYDPELDSESPWYMLIDTVTFTTVSCGSDKQKVLGAITSNILKYKTRDKYLRSLDEMTYTTKPSPTHKALMKAVYDTYGYYYEDEVQEAEDKAYVTVTERKPFNKVRKKFKKTKDLRMSLDIKEAPKEVSAEIKTGKKLKRKNRIKMLGAQ